MLLILWTSLVFLLLERQPVLQLPHSMLELLNCILVLGSALAETCNLGGTLILLLLFESKI